MLIYVKTNDDTDRQLRRLSDELYSNQHADKELVNFYYGFTPHETPEYEEPFHKISFEITGNAAQRRFLEMIDADFNIIRVDLSEGGEEVEGPVIAEWQATHSNRSLPARVTKPPIVFKLMKRADAHAPESEPASLRGRCYYEANGNHILLVTNKYSPAAYEEARNTFYEVQPAEYDQISAGFSDAPATYVELKEFFDKYY